MVVVKIEIWPRGEESEAKTIAVARIANDGTGTTSHGNYAVSLSHSGKFYGRPGPWKTGRVQKFNRLWSPYHLVFYALKFTLGLR
jgi:hypothetical protein